MTTCRKPAHRAYYVRYPRDFANEYSLRYTVSGAELSAEDGWERITRREAERLARAERARRRWEPSRSGYADVFRALVDLALKLHGGRLSAAAVEELNGSNTCSHRLTLSDTTLQELAALNAAEFARRCEAGGKE